MTMRQGFFLNKKQKFKDEIRQKNVEDYRQKIRQEINQKSLQAGPNFTALTYHTGSCQMTHKNSCFQIHKVLEEYSLKHSAQLWGNKSIISHIFSILSSIMLEREGKQIEREIEYIVSKINNIIAKMVANQIEWDSEVIQYLALGSAVCVPIFLTAIEGFSRSLIPIYKKNAQNFICKAAEVIESRIKSEKRFDSSRYIDSYLNILKNLYLTVPKIKVGNYIKVFSIFQTITQYSTLIQMLTPTQYKNKTLCNIIVLDITTFNIQYLVESGISYQVTNFFTKILYTWDENLDAQNRISFYKMLQKMCEFTDVKVMKQFFRSCSQQICTVFRSELALFRQIHRSSFSEEIRLKKLLSSFLGAVSSYLLSQTEDSIICHQNRPTDENNKFLLFLQEMVKFHEIIHCYENIDKDLAYFYYSIIEILDFQKELLTIISNEALNQLIYEKIKESYNVSKIVVWMKVLEMLITKIRRQGIFIGNAINKNLIDLVSEIYSNHHHQKVVLAAQNVLQIFSEANQ